ncbi:putative Alpha/beta hydrolase fold [Candidatus Sulfopaludibacter sp. SbA3]|nr:putative Alpha/beta hydrolase fold [Candidatus Sulfopaludibacter sp. SbA3]
MKHLLTILLFATCASAATVDGIAIHFTVTGNGPKTVILVPGWTCDETSWSEQVPALAAHYRAVTLDLPGHGKTALPADGNFSMDLFARAVEAVRAEIGAERVVLAGHSMGTPVIVQYARLYPRHVSALVFVDGLMSQGGRKAPGPSFLGEEGHQARENMVRRMFTPATTGELRAKIEHMMLAPSDSAATGAIRTLYDPAIWKNDVLSMPILGLYADKSGLGDRAYMKDHFPHMEYHEIPGTDHFLMLEKPADFNRLLIEFLDRQKF